MNWHQFCLSKGENYYQKFNNSCLIILVESYQTPVISVDRLKGQGHENNFTAAKNCKCMNTAKCGCYGKKMCWTLHANANMPTEVTISF